MTHHARFKSQAEQDAHVASVFRQEGRGCPHLGPPTKNKQDEPLKVKCGCGTKSYSYLPIHKCKLPQVTRCVPGLTQAQYEAELDDRDVKSVYSADGQRRVCCVCPDNPNNKEPKP